jgi:DNA-binding PadR family transcriptional regulator
MCFSPLATFANSALKVDQSLSSIDRKRRTPEDLLPLKPLHFLMLLTLADGDRHAYGIKKDLAARQAYGNIGPGTLYRTIEQLIASGLIEETDRRPVPELDDERRRYYRLTPFGRRVAVAEADRLADLLKAASVRKLIAVPYRP